MGNDKASREAELIAATPAPVTRAAIARELHRMGLCSGDVVLMHTALSRLGWVCGGEQSVLEAVFDVLGPSGTLVMPGFSSQLSDPINWGSPGVPAHWVDVIRDNMPVFDPNLTPIRGIGRVAELFRKSTGTKRSDHPVDSFLARGPLADQILADHPFDNSLGNASPLGTLFDCGAKILLLGAGYGSCTAFHLAEDGLPGVALQPENYPIRRENGVTQWATAQRPPTFEEFFPKIGAELDEIPDVVAKGFDNTARLFDMRVAVGKARDWFAQNDTASAR